MIVRVARCAVLLLLGLLAAGQVQAQDAAEGERAERADEAVRALPHALGGAPGEEEWNAGTITRFLAGGALGLGLHEGAHVLTASVGGTGVGLKRVAFGPLPFFAITHDPVSSPREYAISSAGFLAQHISSEWLLTRRPGLRRERAPIAKGVLAFNVLTSTAYASAALARVGPHERDTRGMADASRTNERVIAAMVLAPAVLDSVRYFKPEARWAVWASRGAKIGMALLALRAR